MKFELETYNRNVPDEDLLADMQQVSAKLTKTTLTIEDYSKHGKYHASTIQRRFGGWLKALKKADLVADRTNVKLDKGKIIEDLKLVAAKLNKDSVTRVEYNNYGQYSASGIISNFGTWSKALKVAGLNEIIVRNISNEDLFLNIEEIWVKLGRQPKYNEIEKPFSKYSSGTYEYRFGTWRKALEAFVLYVNNGDDNSPTQEKEVANTVMISTKSTTEIGKHKTKRNINWRLRFIVMRRDNFKCKICGRNPATDPEIVLHVDHILAWDKGGETVYENLQTLCSVCNIGKSNLNFNADENGSH